MLRAFSWIQRNRLGTRKFLEKLRSAKKSQTSPGDKNPRLLFNFADAAQIPCATTLGHVS
jgi:hypothetical protein